jgi:hypothetical protein
LTSALEGSAQSNENAMDALMQMPLGQAQDNSVVDEIPPKSDEPSASEEGRPTKRKRPTVDYQKMYEQMKKEGLV